MNLANIEENRPGVLAENGLAAIGGFTAEQTEPVVNERISTMAFEANYHLLFESIPLPVFIYDLETFQLLNVNKAASALYGYERDEFLAMTVMELRPSEDVEKLLRTLPSLASEPRNFGIWRHRKKDGTNFYVEVTSYALALSGRRVRVSVVNDVTQRRRNEAELSVISEIIQGVSHTTNLDELLRLIHRSLCRVIYAENFFLTLYDEQTQLFTFPFFIDKYDSAPAATRMSKSCTAYVFRTGKSLLLTEDRYQQLIRQGEIELLGTHSPSWLGVPLRTPAKTIGVLVMQHYEDANAYCQHDLDLLESVAGQIALAIERKRSDEALRETNQTLQEIIQSVPMAITAFAPDGRVKMWNAASERIFGWTAEEAMNGDINSIPEELREESRIRREEVLNGGRFSDFETQRLTKDGALIDVSISAAPLLDTNGETGSVLIVAADISERKRSAAMLRQTEDQLRQSQKMEAIGLLAGGVAHDFNNLLTAIIGYSQLLLGRPNNDEKSRTSLQEIKKAGDRAASLTSQLLAFSRKQVLTPKIMDLNSIVLNTEKMLRRLIGEDISLNTSLQTFTSRVKVDPGQIEQVIMNLAVNARDAMPNGGGLTIETADVVLDEHYAKRHAGIAPGCYVMLAVSDTGCGIDAETQSRIFEPFFTTKEVGKGTGLGLLTVYGIVKQSGGYIWVYSELKMGTTFKIYLPRFTEESDTLALDLTERKLPAGSETILLVEDEEVVRTLVKSLLSERGYRILSASSGKEALRISWEHDGPIHLMLSDVVMSQMNGPELARILSQSRPDMKILFMSGYTGSGLHNLKVSGASRPFLQKPFTLDSLAMKVRGVIDGDPLSQS